MKPLLKVSGLACGHGASTVIAGIGFEVGPGEVLAVVGPNGAGKTTLLHTLGRLLPPRAGGLELEGTPAGRMPLRAFARKVALAPQRTVELAWPMRVEEFVSLGRAPHRGWLLPYNRADRQIVANAMERLAIAPLAGRETASLSGGELRRALLARALAQEPRLMLLDEPAAYLDLHYQSELLGLIRALAKEQGIAVILTIHDFTLAALCADRIALLHNGRLRALGKPGAVFNDDTIKTVYGEQMEVFPHPHSGMPVVLPKLRQ